LVYPKIGLINGCLLLQSLKALKSFKPQTDPYRLDKLAKNQAYIIDATERPVQRDAHVENEYYSGKKMHTIKNLLEFMHKYFVT
jgi:hypothetical protein